MNNALASISESTQSLKTLYFRPPGIFTNALIGKPDIMTLLRDADAHENALYAIDAQDKPERRDGARGVVDSLNDDMDLIELQQQQRQGQAGEDVMMERPSVVLVPKDAYQQQEAPDHNKGVKNLLSTFSEGSDRDYGVDVLVETVSQLLDKYSLPGVKEEVSQYKHRWETLNTTIMQHEETIEKQRRQLSLLNISLNDRELLSDETREKPVKTAAQLIAEEEEEIRQLETELARRATS